MKLKQNIEPHGCMDCGKCDFEHCPICYECPQGEKMSQDRYNEKARELYENHFDTLKGGETIVAISEALKEVAEEAVKCPDDCCHWEYAEKTAKENSELLAELKRVGEVLKKIANDKEFSHTIKDGMPSFVRKVWYVEFAKEALSTPTMKGLLEDK